MKILIVEDDANIRELLQLYLQKEGYETILAENGVLGMSAFEREKPDMVLLDIMMPAMDGWQVCSAIRNLNTSTPIIMLTAKGEVFDRVTGLEMGADDYLVKPLDMREVVARVRAIFRRCAPIVADKITFENLIIDKTSYEITIAGKRTDMPPKEIELLHCLASSPNSVFTRTQLLDAVWGFDYYGDTRTVDVHIKRLREKLENVSDKWEVKTVWGVGYKFELRD